MVNTRKLKLWPVKTGGGHCIGGGGLRRALGRDWEFRDGQGECVHG